MATLEYKIVSTWWCVKVLEDLVNVEVQNGFEPVGGIAACDSGTKILLCQAMTKK